jgi:uncharacterized HAD superfamily protein
MTEQRECICVDIDNTIVATDEVIRELIREHTNGDVCLQYDDIREFNYEQCSDSKGASISDKQWDAVHKKFSQRDTLLSLKPLAGAVDGLHRVAEVATLHIATSRRPESRRATVEWLEGLELPKHYLHFVGHLEKHLSVGNVRFAVEDHYEQAAQFAKAEVHTFLLQHPWNRDKPRLERVEWCVGWPQMTERIIQAIRER